ncbi:MAG: hypothetical protein A2096_04430 [Spirochaetes bacterium GWF1_41_5]|nr:MAG: hypothetical protein A2096_04430 [Spirochaetes bacterium GWF1_41_5]HBE03558.1 hypothetical protein [Spirochaetia bacterium]
MIFLIVTLLLIIISFIINREKTLSGLKKGLMMFVNMLGALLAVLALVSLVLYLIPSETIVKYLGQNSGTFGIFIAALAGSISMIPGFVAFPLAALLRDSGVSVKILAIFITTLMMVGILTLPVEIKFFGVRASLFRNLFSFLGAIFIGIIMGFVL